MALIPPPHNDTDRTAVISVGAATNYGQRFRLSRPHARGGLGEVFVALDVEPHREVALKLIFEKHADDPVRGKVSREFLPSPGDLQK